MVEEREAFIESQSLERRDELRALQSHIDETLSRLGRRNRLRVIMGMMYESLADLRLELARAGLVAQAALGPGPDPSPGPDPAGRPRDV